MDSKNNNQTPSDIEQFFSKLPCPIFLTVFSSFILVYLIGFIFNRGIQVYPIYNEILPDDDCPECRVFNGTKASITERQFRIIYQVISPLEITQANAWRLLRIRIYGPIFSQEMRANTDNCGLYAYGVHQSAMHFELIQEGPTTVELYCLDKLMLTVKSDVTRYNRNTESTLFHTSIKEVSNICRVEEGNDEYFVFFSKSNVFNYTHDKKYTFIPRLKHKRQPYEEFIKENTPETINNVFRIDYTNEDINKMTYHELFEKVLLVVFVQSHFGQTIIFSYNKNVNKDNTPYFDLFQKITDGKIKSHSNHNYKNVFCYQKMTTIPNIKKINELTESEYEIFRKSAVGRDKPRGNKIYLASNFSMADELDQENNIYFFGEEKVLPPTQSPTPPPSQSPEPSPSQSAAPVSATPVSTKKPLKTTKPANSTEKSGAESQKTKSVKSSSKSKQTDKSIETVEDSNLTNSTTPLLKPKLPKNEPLDLSNSTSLNSNLSKHNRSKKLNSTSSDSKQTKPKSAKMHSNSTSSSKLRKKSDASSSSAKKKITSKKKENSVSSNTTLLDNEINNEDLGTAVLLSYPDNEIKTFSLDEKIEMLSQAKALISIDDNNEVLHAFWMPRESPLILILPPVRTSISSAAKRINATGRTIFYVQGEREGAVYPDEYKSLASKCMNDVETANTKECDDVFKVMKFKFDKNKVLDIVNKL